MGVICLILRVIKRFNMKNNEEYEKNCQMREYYEEYIDVLCHLLEDIVPLKVRVAYKKRKLRVFDAVYFRTNRKPPQRGKMRISIANWLDFYLTN